MVGPRDAVRRKKIQSLTPGSLQFNGKTDLGKGLAIVVSAMGGDVPGIDRASSRGT